MQAWAKLKVDENPGLGRLYRNHGRRPISGQVDVRILGEYGTIDLTVENLRPLGGDVTAPSGPLAAAASPMAYQVWVISESEGENLALGGFNADGEGFGRLALDFDPNNVCRSGIDINGYSHFAIAPMIDNGGGVAPITIAFARLPGDLATFHDARKPIPATLLAGAEEKADSSFDVVVEGPRTEKAAEPPEPPKAARKAHTRPKVQKVVPEDSEPDPDAQ